VSKDSIVKFFDAEQSALMEEQVFGEGILKWLYESRAGSLFGHLLTRSLPCFFYGKLKDTLKSSQDITNFIKDYNVVESDFPPASEFKTFNEYFAREFLPGKRTWSEDKNSVSAFCEGRYLISDASNPAQLKGSYIEPYKLLGEKYGEEFKDATALICRLAPVDYHWFHYPDDGESLDVVEYSGWLNSVSPISLRSKPDVLNTNKRVVNILDCKNLGRVAFVEIGAFCVGTIVQKHNKKEFNKLDPKGHFLFGGSTVVMLFKDKNIEFNSDLKKYSEQGIETYFKLGADIGRVVE
jgi:phosphatidylserine decarboxylase